MIRVNGTIIADILCIEFMKNVIIDWENKMQGKRMKLSEKLLKILVENTNLCVRDITFDVDVELNKKYLENCCNYKRNNKSNTTVTCKKCWEEFLTNDLIKVESYDLDDVKLIVGGEEISGYVQFEKLSEYGMCQNAADRALSEITATVDDEEIIGPCKISIITEEYAEIKEIRERVRNGINQDIKRKENL